MAKVKQVRVKKKEPLNKHIQTSITDIEYSAIEPIIMNIGESKTLRMIIQYALKHGFLKTI